MLKKFFLFAGLLMAACVLNAQNNPLILKYFVSDATNAKIRLNTQGGYSYTYTKTNNASITGSGTGSSGVTEITVPQIGTYNVSIFPTGSFKFSGGMGLQHLDKITEISQWGDITWNPDLSNMFSIYTNIQITATDIPDFSNVTNMSYMFSDCTNLSIINGINNWDVSNVTNMSGMFSHSPAFNKNISGWNTANVTNMANMFRMASLFDQNISSWNVSNVTNTSGMFAGASTFNQNIGSWNVANVTDMSNMFSQAQIFNQNIGGWNVGNVSNMERMFSGATNFNQNITNWNVANVTDFSYMFQSTSAFNQNISTWDVSNALNMTSMFYAATNFNQDLGNWNLSPLVNLSQIFDNTYNMTCNSFGATLKGWAQNANSPLGRIVGVQGKNYGPGGQLYMNQLINNKGWTFTGNPQYVPMCTETFLSVEDVKQGTSKLTVYPNPATETVFIKAEQRAKMVQLIDASGKMVLNAAATSQISVQHLPAGIYLVKVTLADGSQSTHKLIKK